jgi:tetratricopeptide (TPR) repeat protein
MKIFPAVLVILVLVFPLSALFPQEGVGYVQLYERGEYREALDTALSGLNEIYSKRVEGKRIPSGYVSLRNTGEDVDLVALFRNRKAEGFFIENNPELSQLHLYAARSSLRLLKRRDALNHYIQALRFRELEFSRDDVIFYEIAAVFKSYNSPEYFRGYTDALEQAYTLNAGNYTYSYELGMALSSTREIKKSIFHLERYVENTPGASPETFLQIASLYDSSGKYIEAEKYYNSYLREVPDNGAIHFALGHLAYERTGNYLLAESSLQAALAYLDEKDIYRRSKSYEYMGDMAMSGLKYRKALLMYRSTIDYQNDVLGQIDSLGESVKETKSAVDELKRDLIQNKDFEKYEEYEIMMEQLGEVEREMEILKNSFKRLNPGKVRWNVAEIYEKTDENQSAIEYYRESIKYNYRSSEARERILKLQLKIKRGY